MLTEHQKELIDALISEAGSNNEYDNRDLLAKARRDLELEIERLNAKAQEA